MSDGLPVQRWHTPECLARINTTSAQCTCQPVQPGNALHNARVALARAALRGEGPWTRVLMEPAIFAQAVEEEFRAARQVIERIEKLLAAHPGILGGGSDGG